MYVREISFSSSYHNSNNNNNFLIKPSGMNELHLSVYYCFFMCVCTCIYFLYTFFFIFSSFFSHIQDTHLNVSKAYLRYEFWHFEWAFGYCFFIISSGGYFSCFCTRIRIRTKLLVAGTSS